MFVQKSLFEKDIGIPPADLIENMKSSINDKENNENQSQLHTGFNCKVCNKNIMHETNHVVWQKIPFCNTICLAQYQQRSNFVNDFKKDAMKTSSIYKKPLKLNIHVITKPPKTARVRNIATMCKPLPNHKSTLAKPITLDKNIQTDDCHVEKVLVPIVVPFYVPTPFPIYGQQTPIAARFPMPVPVPIFQALQNLSTLTIQENQPIKNKFSDNLLCKVDLFPVLPSFSDNSEGMADWENSPDLKTCHTNLLEKDNFSQQNEVDTHMHLKYTYGLNAFNNWATGKEIILNNSSKEFEPFKPKLLGMSCERLSDCLCAFIKGFRNPNGNAYSPDTLYYLCLGIQHYLNKNNKNDNIFFDSSYEQFTDTLHGIIIGSFHLYNDPYFVKTRIEEEHLWESQQLGAYSPKALLNTLIFFHAKNFGFMTVQSHMKMGITNYMKHLISKKSQKPAHGKSNVSFRYDLPLGSTQENTSYRKIYEVVQNLEDPTRCPVKLFEFYLSKCPTSVKTRSDIFYLQPEKHCTPDSPFWYSLEQLPEKALEKMLYRILLVKEINVARIDV